MQAERAAVTVMLGDVSATKLHVTMRLLGTERYVLAQGDESMFSHSLELYGLTLVITSLLFLPLQSATFL